MESKNNGGFHINVNCPGNFIAEYITFNGPVSIGAPKKDCSFSDEQIRKALMEIVGEKKVINLKWKWAGAYWYLRWECKFPVDPQQFCDRIESLKLEVDDKYRCDYDNIRRFCTLSFMDYNPKKMDEVKYSKSDLDVFMACREIALKLAEELGKSYLPKS